VNPIAKIHGEYVLARRVQVLAECLEKLIPQGVSVLDVGCGGGQIAQEVMRRRPDVEVKGIDVLLRDSTCIPVQKYDGTRVPYPDESFDLVLLVDVLHHTEDPRVLMRESVRVARRSLLVKDHLMNGWLAGPILRLMDLVGNRHFGVHLPYNYWKLDRWRRTFDDLDLEIGAWLSRLGLYPFPANLVFERGLHFLARLDKSTPSDSENTK